MKTSFKERFDRWPNWRMQTVFFETARDKNSFDGVHFRQSILDNRSSGTMAGKWTALAVAALALLAIARADFHQEDTEATLTREASSRLKEKLILPSSSTMTIPYRSNKRSPMIGSQRMRTEGKGASSKLKSPSG